VCKTAHKVLSRAFKLPSHKQEAVMALHWGSEWQQCYVEALLETDARNLVEKVACAEKAILLRVEELCLSSSGEEEWQSIEDAVAGLAVLRREILKSSIGIKKDQSPDIVKPRMLAS
jgi:hypothetical protein